MQFPLWKIRKTREECGEVRQRQGKKARFGGKPRIREEQTYLYRII